MIRFHHTQALKVRVAQFHIIHSLFVRRSSDTLLQSHCSAQLRVVDVRRAWGVTTLAVDLLRHALPNARVLHETYLDSF